MRKIVVTLLGFCTGLSVVMPAYAAEDTFVFTNETGRQVNDLHVDWSRAVTIKKVTKFKRIDGSGTGKADFSNGTVEPDESVEVTVTWDGSDPKVKSWYWTVGGRKVRDENPGSVAHSSLVYDAGMTILSAATSAGWIQTFLPDTLFAGDTLRGTVIARPKGETPQERQEATNTLRGYVVEVNGKRFRGGSFSWAIPAALAGTITTLTVKDASGNKVVSKKVPIAGIDVKPIAPDFNVPGIIQPGKPTHIEGPFDSTLPTKVTVGGREAVVITQSCAGATIAVPGEVKCGPQEVEIECGDRRFLGETNCVAAEFRADKNVLQPGETTRLEAKISGLEGAPDDAFPVEVTLTCKGNAQFKEGGTVIQRKINKSDVGADGTVALSVTLLGLAPGAFEVSCVLSAGKCGREKHVMLIGKLSKGKDNKGYFVDWREDCYQGNCHKEKNHAGPHAYSWKECADKTHASVPHKEYFDTREDRDARYEELEQERKKREVDKDKD